MKATVQLKMVNVLNFIYIHHKEGREEGRKGVRREGRKASSLYHEGT